MRLIIIPAIHFLVLFLSVAGCTADQDLKSYAESLRTKNSIPGMAIAIVNADSIVELHTLGYRHSQRPDPIEVDDHFHIGSVAKAMTAFVAAHLVEQGRIDWSTSFIELFPDWKDEIDSAYWNVTLDALLSHRGKIQAFWTDAEFASIQIEPQSKSEQRLEFIRYAMNRPRAKTDSLGFLYSNAGYTIAAQMLEKASGSTWEELMIKVFNEDLNLDIGFSWPNRQNENQPWGHWTEKRKLIPCPPDDDYDLDWIEPGGDVHISMPNYCKYIQLHLKGLTGQDNYLRAETFETLQTDSRDSIYAYGWGNFAQDGRSYSTHGGSAGTFLTNILIDKSQLTAYVVMMNTDSPAARELVQKLTDKMRQLQANPQPKG
ncbi:MAG: serine hydrolase domain-containing protein [Bacteroidota bacterium]